MKRLLLDIVGIISVLSSMTILFFGSMARSSLPITLIVIFLLSMTGATCLNYAGKIPDDEIKRVSHKRYIKNIGGDKCKGRYYCKFNGRYYGARPEDEDTTALKVFPGKEECIDWIEENEVVLWTEF